MQRGVSAQKEDIHNAIRNIDKGLYPKSFCKIVSKRGNKIIQYASSFC